ncbi:MAG: hypothetical protein KAI24_01165 [Planctomycetes bacterium]|nr:hypothetical protein [Planctomycetota bacterium]
MRIAVALVLSAAACVEFAAAQQLRPMLGKVVDAAGAPLAGATVCCALPDYLNDRHRALAVETATTDARGRFRVNVRPCTHHLLWVIGPIVDVGERPCSEVQWVTSGGLVEVRADQRCLPSTLTVSGLDAWPELAPFRLRIALNGVEIPTFEAEIAAAGSLALPPLPAGRFHLDVVDKHGQPLYGRSLTTNKLQLTATVPPPQELPMRAVDGDGQPVAGARIRQRLDGGWAGNRALTGSPPARHVWRQLGETDAEGRLVARIASRNKPLEHTGWQRLMFVAERDGHKTTHSGVSDNPYFDGKEVDREGVRELKFTMPKAEPVRGRLLLAADRGLADQRLAVRLGLRVMDINGNGWTNENLVWPTVTDADGRFHIPRMQGDVDEIDVMLAGDDLHAKLVPEELRRRTPLRAIALHGTRSTDDAELEFTVGGLPQLQLQVLDAHGGPAGGMELLFVSCASDNGARCDPWTPTATTDNAGRIAMLLQPGRWLVFGRTATNMVQLNLDLRSDERHELRLQPMPAMFGTVVDKDGAPIADARLECHSSTWRGRAGADQHLASIASNLNWHWIGSTRTDADGKFRCAFLDLPGVSYEARFRVGTAQSKDFPVEASEQPVTITVEGR